MFSVVVAVACPRALSRHHGAAWGENAEGELVPQCAKTQFHSTFGRQRRSAKAPRGDFPPTACDNSVSARPEDWHDPPIRGTPTAVGTSRARR